MQTSPNETAYGMGFDAQPKPARKPVHARMHGALSKLENSRAQWMVFGLALALVAPSWLSGFTADDYFFLYKVFHPNTPRAMGSGPFDLFRWIDPAHTRLLIDGGGLAWWSYPGTRIAFMRPLTSLTHTLDAWLWPHSALLMHVHSTLWFVALIALARLVYAELVDQRWTVSVAFAMFALDSAHGVAVGWIANRNALVAGVFGIAAVLFQHRAYTRASTRCAVLAVGCCALSLLGGELGVGTVGYLVAYALCMRRDRPWKRVASLWPYATVFAAWALARNALGYGVYGMGGYLDPVRQPWAFARVLPSRIALLFSSQVWRASADFNEIFPPGWRWPWALFALWLALVTLRFAWPNLRAQRPLRFLLLGAILSIVPVCAAVPSDRLLTLAGLGLMPVLAEAMRDALSRLAWDRETRLRRRCAVVLAVLHLGADPLMLSLGVLVPLQLARSFAQADAGVPSDPQVAHETVFIAKLPNSALMTYLPVTRAVTHRAIPRRLHWFMVSRDPSRMQRLGPNKLRLTAPTGMFDVRWDERASSFPLHVGQHVDLTQMRVTIVKLTKDGRPKVCDFEFAHPLEWKDYVWRTWRDDHLEPLRLPRIGQSVAL